MPYQRAVTLQAVLDDGADDALARQLATLESSVAAGRSPFDTVPDVHFARLTMLPATTLADDTAVPASLLYAADVDGSPRKHLRRLADNEVLCTAAFSWCAGYPRNADARARRSWLRQHQIPCAAAYVNTVGRGVRQILDEARLRTVLEERLGSGADDGSTPAAEISRDLRSLLADDPTLGFALQPAAKPALWQRVGYALELVLGVCAALAALPVLLCVLPVFLIALRRAERAEPSSTARPDPAAVESLRAQEDRFAYNSFTAIGDVKPTRFRRFTLAAVLVAIRFATRHVFTRGSLAGVTTIHFARWVYLDDRKRVVFLSYYDGSLENYMDDFIDRVAWGLNAVFSSGVGYPNTRWLVFGGARHEDAFKNHLRCHQLPNQVSYCPYPDLSAGNVNRNAAIRLAIARPSAGDDAWLELL